MKFEIKSWMTGGVLFSIETDSFKLAVEAAVKSEANLTGANLTEANLTEAKLTGAKLTGADLTDANLSGADLSGANLYRANLTDANLSGANLYRANLTEANLTDANLSGAKLTGADLTGAKLTGANLTGANLEDVRNADLVLAQTLIVPDGAFFGWKKCRDNVLVRLFIPSKARRSNASGRKCRAERAKVLEVIGAEVGVSQYNTAFTYKVGQWVHCDNWNEDRWVECGGGIHFFITRIEAENY